MPISRTSVALLGVLISATAQAQSTPGAEASRSVGNAAPTATPRDPIISVEQRPRFLEYLAREHRSSSPYAGELRAGAVLPEHGIAYYTMPSEYHVKPGYRYAYVNERPIIVEPRTRRIIEIIEPQF